MLLGPIPTPAVAYLTRTLHATAGIVISASHNSYSDNGVKFFSGDGAKLSDDAELEIEKAIDSAMETAGSTDIGKAVRVGDAAGRYIEFCKSTVSSGLDLHGLRIAVDCAHGATYHVAPSVFSELGAEGDPDRLRARRPEHQRRLRRGRAGRAVQGGTGQPRGSRHRVRRRRRPGGDGGCRRGGGGRGRAPLHHRRSPPCRRAARRAGGRDRDVESRARGGTTLAGDRAVPRASRRPLRAGVDVQARLRDRRRGVGAHHLPGSHHHRGRDRFRPPGSPDTGPVGTDAGRCEAGHVEVSAGVAQRPGREARRSRFEHRVPGRACRGAGGARRRRAGAGAAVGDRAGGADHGRGCRAHRGRASRRRSRRDRFRSAHGS